MMVDFSLILFLSVFFACSFLMAWNKEQGTKNKVFLLVLDGFIHDYDKHSPNMVNFAKLASEGVKAERMIPAFPSSTWPCMTTLNTGLYPESHGIINNIFIDSESKDIFSFQDDPGDFERNGRFFTQEPLWLSNQRQGGVSLVYYWPGYYAFPEKPNYHNKQIVPEGANISTGRQAIDETFEYLSSDPALNFMVVYIDAPDETGHMYGPSSKQYKNMLEQLDEKILGYLLKKLESYEDINLIVVADHGQHDVLPFNEAIRFYEDFLGDNSTYQVSSCGPTCNFKPEVGHTTEEMIDKLKALTDTGHYKVYVRGDPKRDFPTNLHYTQNKNIFPVLVLPDPGYIITSHSFKPKRFIKGTHGYDNAHESMSTIFLAKGPAFRKGVSLPPFESVNVVPLLAHLLGVQAKPNNGSLNVFKHVLRNETSEELPAKYSLKIYLYIFVGCFFILLIVFVACYFSAMFCYAYFFKTSVKYVLVQ